jgi:hypothetical protein
MPTMTKTCSRRTWVLTTMSKQFWFYITAWSLWFLSYTDGRVIMPTCPLSSFALSFTEGALVMILFSLYEKELDKPNREKP